MLLSTIGPPQGYEPVFACTDNVSQGVSWCSGECRWDQSSERDRYGCHEGKIGVNVLLNRFTVSYNLVYVLNQELQKRFLYDLGNGGIIQRKGKRQQFATYQTIELERQFQLHRYLTRNRKMELSRSIALTERQVEVWFQNRRAKRKRQMRDQNVNKSRPNA